MNWYKQANLKQISSRDIVAVFERIIFAENYSLLKMAQSLSIPEAYIPRAVKWYESGKNVPWLMNKYKVPESVVKRTLDRILGKKWRTEEKRRKIINLNNERFLRKIQKQVINTANRIAQEGHAVSVRNLAAQFGATKADIFKILDRSRFDGRILGKREGETRISENIRKKVVQIQTEAIRRNNPLTIKQIQDEIEEETGEKISHSSVIRIISRAGLRTKHQLREPELTDLLNTFWAKTSKGFWNSISRMDELSQVKMINKYVDEVFLNPAHRKKVKNFFLQKIQLRDLLLQEVGEAKASPIERFKQITSAQKQQVINLYDKGFEPEEIAIKTGLEQIFVENIIQDYQWRNFQFQKQFVDTKRSHPGQFLMRPAFSLVKKIYKITGRTMNWYKRAKDWSEHLRGGKADGKEPTDFNQKALEKGQSVEFEHTNDPDLAKEIAMDHLEEFPDYYEGLEKMEKSLKKKKKKDNKCLHSLAN